MVFGTQLFVRKTTTDDLQDSAGECRRRCIRRSANRSLTRTFSIHSAMIGSQLCGRIEAKYGLVNRGRDSIAVLVVVADV